MKFNYFSKTKKGQMEMVGLVVIVVLITLGTLIFATISISQGQQEKKIFLRKGLAYSTMSALTKTTVGEGVCGVNLQLQLGGDILDDCAANFASYNQQELELSGFSNYPCGTYHSCEFFKQQVKDLLQRTLGKLNKRYEFESRYLSYEGVDYEGVEGSIPTIVHLESDRGNCPPTRERDTSTFFPLNIEATGGQVLSVLYICD